MATVKPGKCDYCGECGEVRGTPILADAAIGARMCGTCWKTTREGGIAAEGIDIGDFSVDPPQPISPTYTIEQIGGAYKQARGGFLSEHDQMFLLALKHNLQRLQEGGGKG